ncbi:hypothetical protein BC835DRAFT_1421546 [Cytidiella melzeri]|nr:hypothetical protein BC835DRAFT_1421546 [Cytidiella melzeri]
MNCLIIQLDSNCEYTLPIQLRICCTPQKKKKKFTSSSAIYVYPESTLAMKALAGYLAVCAWHIYHTLCVNDRLNVSLSSEALCPMCRTGFRHADLKRIFIDFADNATNSFRVTGNDTLTIPEHVRDAFNRRLEGLASEQAAVHLRANSLTTQVTAAEKDLEELREYCNKITVQNVGVELRIGELEALKVELSQQLLAYSGRGGTHNVQ